jgi:hypothetical protein
MSWVDDADAFSDSDEDVTSVEIKAISRTPKSFGRLAASFELEARQKKALITHDLSVIEHSGAQIADKCRALKSTNFYIEAEKKQERGKRVAIRKVPTEKKLAQKLASLKKQKSAFRFSWHDSQKKQFIRMASKHEKANARGKVREAPNLAPLEGRRSPSIDAEQLEKERKQVQRAGRTREQQRCDFVFEVLRKAQGNMESTQAWGVDVGSSPTKRKVKKTKLRIEFRIELGSVGSEERKEYTACLKGIVKDVIRLIVQAKLHAAFTKQLTQIQSERRSRVVEEKMELDRQDACAKKSCDLILWFCKQAMASSFSTVFRRSVKQWLKRLIFVQNRWRMRKR